jgi:hypothetical protein
MRTRDKQKASSSPTRLFHSFFFFFVSEYYCIRETWTDGQVEFHSSIFKTNVSNGIQEAGTAGQVIW